MAGPLPTSCSTTRPESSVLHNPMNISDNEAVQKQIQRNQQLRERLEQIRKRRQQLQNLVDSKIDPQLQATLHRLESLHLQRQETLDQYQSSLEHRTSVSRYLEYAQKWNVTNDCFHIWHHGPFGTINGLRLGAEAPPLPVLDDIMAKVGSAHTITIPSSPNGAAAAAIKSTEPPRRYHLFSSSMAATVNNNTSPAETHAGTYKPEAPLKIPWIEINSALGQVALLLHVLEQKPHSGISYGHEIQPMGSTSKIGISRSETAAVTYYNLCSDDGFSLFGKRNFNIALQTLLECIYTAAHAIQQRDRTIAIPHAIQPPRAQQHLHQHQHSRANNNTSAEWTIGGLSIHYGLDGVEWTRAMKYLLTNVKWLVAYSAKHVDL
jgi:hypothetical protein